MGLEWPRQVEARALETHWSEIESGGWAGILSDVCRTWFPCCTNLPSAFGGLDQCVDLRDVFFRNAIAAILVLENFA